MALSDLQVFNEYAREAFAETLDQQVNLFNAATDGGLTLRVAAFDGDFSSSSFYKATSDLVRRRNPYGSGALTEKVLTQGIDTIVKVAAGTPPVRMDKAWWNWIGANPSEAGVVLGRQLAPQVMADYLAVAVGALRGAMVNVGSAVVHDISALTGGAEKTSPASLADTAIKLGDRMSDIRCWVMHSKVWNDLFKGALTNAEGLFSYGTTNIVRDAQGRRFVIADIPGIVQAGSPVKYTTLGLSANAAEITQQDDFDSAENTITGDENIKRVWQGEWSFGVGLKGFRWDTAAGGHAPTTASLLTGTNWVKTATSNRDLGGVLQISQ